MSDKNFKKDSYPLNKNKFLTNNNENQVDAGAETPEKPEKFEKFKKNFSKTLAASLAVLNLFSGSFAKAANADDSITTNVGDSKKKDSAANKKINADSKKENLLSAKSAKGKEVKVNQNKLVTKNVLVLGSVVLAASLVVCAAKKWWWPKSELVRKAETWLNDCNVNRKLRNHWLKGIDIVKELIRYLRKDFEIENASCQKESELFDSLLKVVDTQEMFDSESVPYLKVTNKENNRCIFVHDTIHWKIKTENDDFTIKEFLDNKRDMFFLSRSILAELESNFKSESFDLDSKCCYPFRCCNFDVEHIKLVSSGWMLFEPYMEVGFLTMFFVLRDLDKIYDKRLEALKANLTKNENNLTSMMFQECPEFI